MREPQKLSAVRAAYDTVACDYGRLLRTELDAKPLDRALLNAFAELVPVEAPGPVADLGCGPGRITAFLHSLGVAVFGVDVSPEMIAVARRSHPDLRFEVGSMTALDRADGALGGIVAWYSIIHTPPPQLPATFSEFHRLLAPGSPLLLAFQVGDECVHLDHAYGHAIALDAYRLSPDRIEDLLPRRRIAGRLAHNPRAGREREDSAGLRLGAQTGVKPGPIAAQRRASARCFTPESKRRTAIMCPRVAMTSRR